MRLKGCSYGLFVLGLIVLLVLPVSFVRGELRKLSEQNLRSVDGREGINLEMSLNADADYLELTDPDGSFTAGSGDPGALRLGDFSFSNNSSSDFTEFTIDMDGSNGLVFKIPNSDAPFDLNVDRLTVPDDPSSSTLNSSADAGRINIQDINLTNTTLEITGENEGLTVDGELPFFNASTVNYRDADASSSSIFSFEDVTISDYGNGTYQYDFTGLSIHFDENGVVINPPSQSFSLSASGVCLYDFSVSTCGSEGDEHHIAQNIEVDDLGFDGSTFLLAGAGHGLEIDGELKFTIDQIELEDHDGTRDSTNSGVAKFQDIRFHDASSGVGYNGGGSAVTISNSAEVHVDQSGGLLLEAPSFDTSGSSFGSPANELYLHNMNVSNNCTDGTDCGDWSLRNFDPGGSWLSLQGRN